MKSPIKFVSLLLGAALLGGCGASQVAVKPELKAQILRVALVRVAEPPAYVANDFGSPGLMFGAVGGAVAGVAAMSVGDKVTLIAQNAGFSAGDRYTAALQSKLESLGYAVKVVEAERDQPHKLIEDYSKVEAQDTDAILDVALQNVGYATEHPMFSPHWRPAAMVQVSMVTSNTHAVVYQEKFMYGYHNPLMSGTDLDAPETYHFKGREALLADEAKLVAGMDASIEAVVQAIGTNLAK